MLAKPVLKPILENDALTRGLADPEARILVEWLVDQAELCASDAAPEGGLETQIQRLCTRARTVGRFVGLWCYRRERGAAVQLAAAERVAWPLPTDSRVDPYELMQSILASEAEQREARASF